MLKSELCFFLQFIIFKSYYYMLSKNKAFLESGVKEFLKLNQLKVLKNEHCKHGTLEILKTLTPFPDDSPMNSDVALKNVWFCMSPEAEPCINFETVS